MQSVGDKTTACRFVVVRLLSSLKCSPSVPVCSCGETSEKSNNVAPSDAQQLGVKRFPPHTPRLRRSRITGGYYTSARHIPVAPTYVFFFDFSEVVNPSNSCSSNICVPKNSIRYNSLNSCETHFRRIRVGWCSGLKVFASSAIHAIISRMWLCCSLALYGLPCLSV